MKRIVLICYAVIIITNVSKAVSIDKKVDDFKDPICQMTVKSGSKIVFTYNKNTYRFCSEHCKKTFSKNPNKYIKK